MRSTKEQVTLSLTFKNEQNYAKISKSRSITC